MHQKTLFYREMVIGCLLLGFAIVLWLYTATFPPLEEGYPGPALFPRLIAVGLGLGGIIILLQILSGSNSKEQATDQEAETEVVTYWNWLRLGLGLLAISIFPFLHSWTGFIPALAATCFLIALALKVRIWLALSVSVGAAAVIYFLFTQLLSVPL